MFLLTYLIYNRTCTYFYTLIIDTCTPTYLPIVRTCTPTYLPIIGTCTLVEGMFSAMSSMNTEKANSIVRPRLIFSPESGFIQKQSRVNIDNITHGMMML